MTSFVHISVYYMYVLIAITKYQRLDTDKEAYLAQF